MEFSSKEDIEAPIDAVFQAISEFETFERQVIRRGVELQRTGNLERPEAGLQWQAEFEMRGKPRTMHVELAHYAPASEMRFAGKGAGLQGAFDLELISLSPRRTRMSVNLSMEANSLAARLFLQSLKLARNNLNKRFRLKVADYAKQVEDRYNERA